MNEWTNEERRWIIRAKRIMRDQPDNVKLYLEDDSLVACRRNVSSVDLVDVIGTGISACAVVSDIHDDKRGELSHD